jgi:probable HAF family extracellular repeat protein
MSSRLVPLSLLLLAATVVSTLTSVKLASAAKPGGTPAAYAIVDLGSPRYRNYDYWRKAYGINLPDNQGLMDIIGWEINGPSERGSTIWEVRANGSVVNRIDLGTNVKHIAVNDNGLIIGLLDSFPSYGLFAMVPGVGVVNLPGSAGFFTAAVNNSGRIVAQQHQAGYQDIGRGAMWTVAADGAIVGPIDLGDFRPLDINDFDKMAGIQDSVAAVARFEAGALQVDKLPGLSPGDLGVATGINNWGDVVGYSTDVSLISGTYRPCLWSDKRGLVALGSLGGVHGQALAINDSGQIVGFSYTASAGRSSSEQRAFLWENDKMFDLNGKIAADSKRTLQSADDINHSGHIVGSMYTIQSGTLTQKSFLLTPTP